MYKAAQAGEASGETDGGAGAQDGGSGGDNVVDAEFEEVDDEEKKRRSS
jgi:hypothetical protein